MLIERMQHYVFPSVTNATATLFVAAPSVSGGTNGGILFTANSSGVGGNLISVQFVIGGLLTPFTITVVGTVITVNIATDGAGNPTQSFNTVAGLMAANPAVSALIAIVGTSAAIVTAFGPTLLAGGSGAAGGASLNQIPLVTDSDAPFRLMGVVVWNLNVENGQGFDGQVSIRFNRPDGRLIQKLLTSSNLLYPGNRYNVTPPQPNKALCSPINPNVVYPPHSTITIDLTGLPTTATNPPTPSFIVIFVGVKLFQPGEVWAPGYPAKWRALSYLDNLTVSPFNNANGALINQYFTPQQNDCDFVWQGGAYTDYPVGLTTPLCQLVDLGVIVRDKALKGYSNGYVPAALLFPFLGAEMPGWTYPEIYIPKQEQISFDFNYLYPGFVPGTSPTALTVVLGLKGMKVYPQS